MNGPATVGTRTRTALSGCGTARAGTPATFALDATTVEPRSTCTNCSSGSATTIDRPSVTPSSAICCARTVAWSAA